MIDRAPHCARCALSFDCELDEAVRRLSACIDGEYCSESQRTIDCGLVARAGISYLEERFGAAAVAVSLRKLLEQGQSIGEKNRDKNS